MDIDRGRVSVNSTCKEFVQIISKCIGDEVNKIVQTYNLTGKLCLSNKIRDYQQYDMGGMAIRHLLKHEKHFFRFREPHKGSCVFKEYHGSNGKANYS